MEKPSRLQASIRWIGLVAAPLLALVCFVLLPEQYRGVGDRWLPFSVAGRATLAVMVWMAVWWLTEAIDISATALLPLALFPLLGIADMKATAAPYAHRLIFLFMGSFLLALSMQRWGLGKRAALLTLRTVGTRPVNMVGGFMLTTAVLSAFVSNTATTAMMLPIAVSLIDLLGGRVEPGRASDRHAEHRGSSAPEGRNFALCLLLGIAYAASIGGVTTIIGTPPNVFLAGFVSDEIAEPYRMEISFARWLLIGVPLAVVFLPITWFLLTRIVFPVRVQHIAGGRELIDAEIRSLGQTNRGEWATLAVFACTVLLWLTRPLLTNATWTHEGGIVRPLAGLTDAGIAMSCALVLFVIPVSTRSKSKTFVMDWNTANKLPWGILILFGGGLSLAAAVKANGVAEFIGSRAGLLAGVPPLALVLLVAATVIFLTELTSNTATTAALVPVLAALAPGLGIHPYLFIFPAAFAASCAFMLPVATPPNAIIFGSGRVSIPQMAKAGLLLNLIGIVLITVLTFLIVPLVLWQAEWTR